MRWELPTVLFLVLLGGCVGVAPDSGPVVDGKEPAQNVTVTVTTVVDGDTIEIRYADGSTDTVRLLGIDTPEIHVDTDPSEFEGVPDTDAGRACLREEGAAAESHLEDTIADRQVRLVFDPLADRRGGYDRLLAYVSVDHRNLNYELVELGYARVYDTQFSQADRFYAAEDRARTDEIGVWRCQDPEETTV